VAGLRAAGAAVFIGRTATTPNSQLLQDDFQRTEVRKGRLHQIKTHERGEPKPVRAVVVREHQAQEDKRAGEPADDHVHFHISISAHTEPRAR
jgi:hypothetical protein